MFSTLIEIRSVVEVEPARIDPARTVAEDRADAAREQAPQLVVAEGGEPADRLDAAGDAGAPAPSAHAG